MIQPHGVSATSGHAPDTSISGAADTGGRRGDGLRGGAWWPVTRRGSGRTCRKAAHRDDRQGECGATWSRAPDSGARGPIARAEIQTKGAVHADGYFYAGTARFAAAISEVLAATGGGSSVWWCDPVVDATTGRRGGRGRARHTGRSRRDRAARIVLAATFGPSAYILYSVRHTRRCPSAS